jgi:hypothetical protein
MFSQTTRHANRNRHRRNRVTPEILLLEGRIPPSSAFGTPQPATITAADVTPTPSQLTITVTASPKTLWPPNGKFVTVTVTGTVTDTTNGINPTLNYKVTDSSGMVLPSGTATLQATNTDTSGNVLSGTFSFTLSLQARRAGTDFNGRQYTITVTAQDSAGNAADGTAVVTVPHDQGHGGGGKHNNGHGHGQGQNKNHGHGHGHGNSSHGHGHGHGKQGNGDNQGGNDQGNGGD